MREFLAILVGYLLGSILPADLFARARGFDIRAVGTRNPGTTNAWRELGPLPGVITGAYDAAVGVVALLFATYLGVPVGWTYLAGIAALVGHCYPIFFGLRGGQGMATSTGLLVYAMGVALSQGWLTLPGIALLAAAAVLTYALTRSATVVGVIVLPMLLAQTLVTRPPWMFGAFMGFLASFIWLTQLRVARHEHLFRFADKVRERLPWLRAPIR